MSQRLTVLLNRMDGVIRDLNVALGRHDLSTVAAATREMCQCLLECRRVTDEEMAHASTSQAVRHQVNELRSQLQASGRALEVQIAAVRQVVSILTCAERASDTDTTYVPVRRRAVS